MNENELAACLEQVLKEHRDDPNFWNRNPIGKLIKNELISRGNWKKRSNGHRNASLGREIQLLKYNLNQNPNAPVPSYLAKYVS